MMPKYETDAELERFKIRNAVGGALVLVGAAIGIWADLAIKSRSSFVTVYGAQLYSWAAIPAFVGGVTLIGEWILLAWDRFRGAPR